MTLVNLGDDLSKKNSSGWKNSLEFILVSYTSAFFLQKAFLPFEGKKQKYIESGLMWVTEVAVKIL